MPEFVVEHGIDAIAGTLATILHRAMSLECERGPGGGASAGLPATCCVRVRIAV